MNPGSTARLIASCLGLAGFAVAIVAGMAAGNPGGRVLTVALISMVALHLVGLVVGLVAERVVEEYVRQYKAVNPVDAPSAPARAAHSEPG